ncbi:MAG: hypothetical protein ACI9QQ_001136 [Myxococcota bacterium]
MDNPAPPTPLLSSVLGFAISLIVLVCFYMVRPREERGWLFRLALGAFLIKAILVPLYFWWLVSIGNFGFAYFDARGHHEEGINIAEEITYDLPEYTWGWRARDSGFYKLTAYTYMLFGPNTLIIRFFLIMCISVSLLYVYRITKLYADERTARFAAGLQAFLPFPILLSLNHRKDPLVQLIVLFMFYHSVKVFRQEPGWMRSAAFTAMGLIAVYPFRSGLILPFIGVMVICFVLANRNVVQGMAVTIVTVMALLTFQLAIPDDSKVNLDTYGNRVEATLEGSARLADAGGLTSLLRVTGLTDIYKIPFAAAVYLILPYPPEFRVDAIGSLSTSLNLFTVFFLPHLLIGVWSLIRAPNWRANLPLLVFPFVFLLVLGAVHIGVIRYKQIFFPVCLIWTAIGWQIGASFQFKFLIYGGLFSLGSAIYLFRYLM